MGLFIRFESVNFGSPRAAPLTISAPRSPPKQVPEAPRRTPFFHL